MAVAVGLDAVRQATIQIVGTGTFQDPIEGEQANVPGSGSGFIISETGLAVTNNHVVTGSAFLEVYVDGSTEPLNAAVVGVSECSDLAVIDIQGDDFVSLEWFEGDITTGLDIRAAGYPLGDPEYTLLEGIVAKESANGESSWASVDAVIEHSADTLPGNSGGPIVTTDGAVVAVNYAGNQSGQSFAIGREVALPVVERLALGENVDSIGINGEAYFDGTFTGIWVYSVASGSPADAAGIQAGDLIIRLESLDLATDGTMGAYCDILRSHSPTDQLAIEVYRPATDEVLAGNLNGEPLTQVFSFATEVDEAAAPEEEPRPIEVYDEFTVITDDSESIVVEVPVEWADTSGLPWDFNGELVGPALLASSDREAWANGWRTPGVFISASTVLPLTLEELLDTNDFSNSCTFAERVDYDDGFYTGGMDVWEDCGGAKSTFLVIAALPPDSSYITLVQIVIVTEANWAVADNIVRTFAINNPQVP